MDNAADEAWNDYYRYGFEVLGPLLFGFGVWLSNKVREADIKTLFFMSRDGFLIKKVFEIIHEGAVNCKYLCVSRRSLGISLISGEDGLHTLIRLNAPGKKWNCKMLCYRLGYEYKKGLKIWKSLGLSEKSSFRGCDILNQEKVILFYKMIEKEVTSNANSQRKLLMSYFEQEGLTENAVIVDTGGNCTSQKYMSKLFGSNMIQGYYLWKRASANDMLAENFPIEERELDFGNMAIVEYFLTSHEGTILEYFDDGQSIQAKRRQYEHDKEDIQIIDEVQKGVLYFANLFRFSYGNDTLPPNVYKNNILAVSQTPSLRVAGLLGELSAYNDEATEKLASVKQWRHYVLHPNELYYDFSKAGWKTGFIKRAIKLPLNYSLILRCLKKALTARKHHCGYFLFNCNAQSAKTQSPNI